MDKNIIPIKGGFPRIKIKGIKIKSKGEQGFGSIYSLKDMLNSKKTIPILLPDEDTEVNIVDNIDARSINGIPLSMITGGN